MEAYELAIVGLGLMSIGLIIWNMNLNKRIKTLTRGKNAQSLESIIGETHASLDSIQQKLDRHTAEITELYGKAKNAVHHTKIVRFNPFKETGGSQSFAVALTNEHNDGVVISSLYARDRMNVFAKPIHNGTSEYTLTKEEQEALKR